MLGVTWVGRKSSDKVAKNNGYAAKKAGSSSVDSKWINMDVSLIPMSVGCASRSRCSGWLESLEKAAKKSPKATATPLKNRGPRVSIRNELTWVSSYLLLHVSPKMLGVTWVGRKSSDKVAKSNGYAAKKAGSSGVDSKWINMGVLFIFLKRWKHLRINLGVLLILLQFLLRQNSFWDTL